MNSDHDHKDPSYDPVKKMLLEQKTFSNAWIGKAPQNTIQRLGFILLSTFFLLIGGCMWWAFFSEPTSTGLAVLVVGTFPLALGIAGLAKALKKS
ncbi:hypothetical protein [Terriglobus albidus]|uniref:hypothetical protein n=1 Tax=Terriglobus albidus TaxID=1592106 RepID=UPI0021DF4CB0|nr:hypothetical protein [Terriglobus albidus]